MSERPAPQREDDRSRGLSPLAIGLGLLAAAGAFALLTGLFRLVEASP